MSAEAAATAGLDRYAWLVGWPILPTKFRFDVERPTSSAARTPIWPPRQGPQVEGPRAAPAWIKILAIPSSIIWVRISGVPGITISLTEGGTFFPARRRAALLKSSRDPLVQE